MENGNTAKYTNGQSNGNSKTCVVKLSQKEDLKKSGVAVQVSNVFYTYERASKDKFVLKGVNLNILKGEIYALLGPSGCGKTTVLKCITKQITPYRGWIDLPISQTQGTTIPGPGVGYMPQELSLFTDLRIGEALWLFGAINGVAVSNLKKKISDLLVEFELPNLNRLIGTLSGGQKRRVSLVAALIHEAPLLILDEPTVGIDPILRKTIWDYMSFLADEGKTILLTTHYIDEAKDATTVGLMREGKLLAELSPAEMLILFNEKSLERCFYLMCVKNENHSTETVYYRHIKKSENEIYKNGTIQTSDRSVERNIKRTGNGRQIRRNVASLMIKNIKQLSRNPFMLVFQFFLPAITIAIFGLCIGRRVFDMPITIFNEEDPPHISEWFMEALKSYPIRPIFSDTLQEAKEAVRLGDSAVAIHIPKDFTLCLRNKYILQMTVDNRTLTCASVRLHMDTTNQIISLQLQQYIYRAFEKMEIKTLKELDSTPLYARLPLSFEEPVYGSVGIQFSEYITPCILLLCAHFLAMALTGFSLGLEKLSGVLERLGVSGVSKIQVLYAQLFAHIIVVAVQVFLMLVIHIVLFHTKVAGNFIHVLLILTLQGICGMLLGFLLSAVADRLSTGIFLGIGIFFPNVFLSGFIWPIQGMSIYMQWIARITPVTLTSEALRSVISRGWGLENRTLWLGYISVILHSSFFLISAILIFKYKK